MLRTLALAGCGDSKKSERLLTSDDLVGPAPDTPAGADYSADASATDLTAGFEAALFLSRTSNVVVVTDMSCNSSCGFDIVSAARSYAEAIATRASEVAAS